MTTPPYYLHINNVIYTILITSSLTTTTSSSPTIINYHINYQPLQDPRTKDAYAATIKQMREQLGQAKV